MVTAASGLWLDFVYRPDAALAWNDVEALQSEIDRGLLIADIRRSWSVVALVATAVWFGLMLTVRYQLALVIAAVLAVSLAARGPGEDWMVVERTVLESGAAVVGVAVAAYWVLKTRPSQLVQDR